MKTQALSRRSRAGGATVASRQKILQATGRPPQVPDFEKSTDNAPHHTSQEAIADNPELELFAAAYVTAIRPVYRGDTPPWIQVTPAGSRER